MAADVPTNHRELVQIGLLSKWIRADSYATRVKKAESDSERIRHEALKSGIGARIGLAAGVVVTLFICLVVFAGTGSHEWPWQEKIKQGLTKAIAASFLGIPLCIVGFTLGRTFQAATAEREAKSYAFAEQNKAYRDILDEIYRTSRRSRADTRLHVSSAGIVTAYSPEWILVCDPRADRITAANFQIMKEVRLECRQLVTSHSDRSVRAIDAVAIGSVLAGNAGAIAGAAHALQLSMPVVSTTHQYSVDCYTWDPSHPVVTIDFEGDEQTAKSVYGLFNGLVAART